MVLQSLASFVCNFIGIPKRPAKTKQVVQYEEPGSGCNPENVGRDGLSNMDSPSPPSSGEVCRCCVCLSGMKDGEDLRVLPCTHRFHGPCIDRWFSGPRKRTCPMCRFMLDGGSGEVASRRWEELTEEMAIWFSSFHVAGF
ncbi:E3 ubiquitin-protein ligase MPSR1 [Punica granatum]|nr:E3 ubiquitin-protein ligase MPSR1 [Punica granatum]